MSKLNAAQFARRRGVDRACVSRWISDGLLGDACKKDGTRYAIDAEKADQLLAERLNHAYRRTRKKKLPSAGGPAGSLPPAGKGKSKKKVPTLAESRAAKEQFLAELRRLELDEKAGRLVALADVEKNAFDLGRQIRNAMLAIPSRVSAVLAAENDEGVVAGVLDQEIRNALQGLAS